MLQKETVRLRRAALSGERSYFFLFNFQTLKLFATHICIVYTGIRLLLLIHPSLYFFIFFLSNFETLKFFIALFTELWGLQSLDLVHMWSCGQWVDVLCIPKSGYCCLFVPYFFIFFLSILFLSKISQGWLHIGFCNLVQILGMTCCIV